MLAGYRILRDGSEQPTPGRLGIPVRRAPRLRCADAGLLHSSLNIRGKSKPARSRDAVLQLGAHLLYLEAEPAALPTA